MLVPTTYLWQQMLVNALAGTPSPGLAGVLTASKVALYNSNIALNNDTKMADITPSLAVYTGYAAQSATFGTPFLRAAGGMAVLSALLQFQMSGPGTGDRIYGYALTNSAGSTLLAAESFGSSGIPITTPLNAITLIVEVAAGGPDWGQAQIDF